MRRVVAAQMSVDANDGPAPRPSSAAPSAPDRAASSPASPETPARSGSGLRLAGNLLSRGSAFLSLGLGGVEVNSHLNDTTISQAERTHRAVGAGAGAVGGTLAAVGAGFAAAAAFATAPAWVPIAAGGAAAVTAGFVVSEGSRWAGDRISRWWSGQSSR